MQSVLHMKTRRPARWPSSPAAACFVACIVVLVSVSGSDAIVKQQQQQQQRSDNSQSSSDGQMMPNHQQSAASSYSGNHQQQQQQQQQQPQQSSAMPNSNAQSSQQQQPTYSSSISVSSSSSSPSSVASPAAGASLGNQQQRASSDHASQSQYGQSAAIGGGQHSSSQKYQMVDQMAAAASNPEQSYQAAANSVNMALASSGIYGSSANLGYNTQPAPQQQGGQQAASSNNQQQAAGSAQSLNPLHYFYYPAKDSGSNPQAAAASAGSKPSMDGLINSASNNYQSMAAYPSYADQLSSALSSMAGAGPDAAASNQDPSYLPQPGNQAVGGDLSQQQPQQHSGGQYGAQQGNSQPSAFSAELNSYLNSMSNGPQQQQQGINTNGQQQHSSVGGGISFNGPSSSGPSANGAGDYMNSHLGGQAGHQQQQASQAAMNAFQAGANIYGNQMGDLSTSNFGNNAGGLASVASYMSPTQQSPQQQQQHQHQQHDLFSNQQFNSAASQLSPSAVSPPMGGQSSPSSYFSSAASALLGGSSQQSSAAAQQAANSAGAGGSLYANQHYLNTFLAPQQFGQASPLSDSSLMASQMLSQQGMQASASSPSSAVTSSGKKYGIGTFIMPMLALAGLSLLIPTMSNIGTAVGRKKRSIEDRSSSSSGRRQQAAYDSMNAESQFAKEASIGEYMDKIERYYSIYKNAVENDDCLNRLICEFGDAVKDVAGKSAVVTVIEKLVPTWMTGKVHLFKEAAHKEGKEKCKKYICNKHH